MSVKVQQESASAKFLGEQGKIVEIRDHLNRKIELKEPDFLDEIEVAVTVGAERSANETYMRNIYPLLYIHSLDGVVESNITSSFNLINALLKRLGKPAWMEVVKGINDNFFESKTKDEDQDINRLKK